MFKDNLSSHRIDALFKHIRDELSKFVKPRFFPAKMTMIIQVIECHIGMQHKKSVRIALRKVIMERLNAALEVSNGNTSVIIKPLKPNQGYR